MHTILVIISQQGRADHPSCMLLLHVSSSTPPSQQPSPPHILSPNACWSHLKGHKPVQGWVQDDVIWSCQAACSCCKAACSPCLPADSVRVLSTTFKGHNASGLTSPAAGRAATDS